MHIKHSGQRSCARFDKQAPSVQLVPGNPHPQLPAIATLFGQHAIAFVDNQPVYSPMVSIPVRFKRATHQD
jgi:hypothetical protein